MTYNDIPILEFDPANDAALDPRRMVERIDMPEHCSGWRWKPVWNCSFVADAYE